jgi:maltooligosyltrehalose trehalohydrolase
MMNADSTHATQNVLRRFPVGAELQPDGNVHFRLWAPRRRAVEVGLLLHDGKVSEAAYHALTPEEDGYFSGLVPGEAGTHYLLRLDQSVVVVADPASRFQPRGCRGPSEVCASETFHWEHPAPSLSPRGQVLYELHIGTFTREGTWQAAAERLRELADLGITVLELMPIAEFPGGFGWGYDGVFQFAPYHRYGTPDDLRRFVDRAHGLGLGVILDVVYNHFGCFDSQLHELSEHYHSTEHASEWGGAINYDGPHCQAVRDYFLANARYWIEEFRLDGYRFDATQAIFDRSESHILRELIDAARAAAPDRSLYLIAENEPQDTRLLLPAAQGGFGLDALWNDDFHHAAHVRLTGANEAYYSDYQGTSQELLASAQHGFLYQGQLSLWQHKPRGSNTRGSNAHQFISFLENHDQVANSSDGLRVHQMTSPARFRAMTAYWLLMPQTPLFFQGQEYNSMQPFLYFADYQGHDARLVAQGRANFMKQFPSLATPEAQAHLHNPADPEVFSRSQLDPKQWEEHVVIREFHRDLLRLRRTDPVFARQSWDGLEGTILGNDAFLLHWSGVEDERRLVAVNFGCDLPIRPVPHPILALPHGWQWEVLWSSEAHEYGGRGTAPLVRDDGWHLPGESTVVLKPTRNGATANSTGAGS